MKTLRRNRRNRPTMAKCEPVRERKTKRKPLKGKVSEGYAFVVQCTTTNEWLYVNFEYATSLGTSRHIPEVYPAITDEMRDFWKRVVIDGVYEWEVRNINPKSMRLVKVSFAAADSTGELFRDDSDMRESQRMAALSKLTDDEAKALKVEKQHTIMKMFRNKDESGISQLAGVLRDQVRDFSVDQIIGLEK